MQNNYLLSHTMKAHRSLPVKLSRKVRYHHTALIKLGDFFASGYHRRKTYMSSKRD